MDIEVIEKEGLKREVKIEVPKEIVDETYEKFYNQYSKKAKLKGFRPGKVPVKVIRSRFKNEVTADVIDEMVGKYYNEAVKDRKLEPIGDPVVSQIEVDEGKPLTFTVGIEVMPKIEKVTFENLKLHRPKIEVPDEEVDRVIEQLRKQKSEARSVDRPAEAGDLIIADLEAIDEGREVIPEPLENQEIDLGNELTVKEFRETLAGVKRDEQRDVPVTYAADYPDEKFAGKTITYRVSIKEVKEQILPTLNDDFARQVGGAETLLELRLNIRTHLGRERENDNRKSEKRQLVDQIVEQNAIDIPEVMLESYFKNVFEDLKQNAEKFDEKEVREKYRQAGLNSIRWYLLYHRLSVQESIEVSNEDTENWIKGFSENYQMEIPKAKELLAKSGRAAEIKDGILEEKILEFLTAKAQVTEG